MDRDSIGILLAATLAGLAVLLAVVALARQPFLLVVAVPFAAGAYLVWRGATGRYSWGLGSMRFREVRSDDAGGSFEGAERRNPFERARRRGPFEETQGRGSSEDARRRGPFRQARGARRTRTGRSSGAGRGRARDAAGAARKPPQEAMDRREAYRVLGLSPGADDDAVKAAYRRKVKAVHPDADGGDPEAFRKVTAAYETLSE